MIQTNVYIVLTQKLWHWQNGVNSHICFLTKSQKKSFRLIVTGTHIVVSPISYQSARRLRQFCYTGKSVFAKTKYVVSKGTILISNNFIQSFTYYIVLPILINQYWLKYDLPNGLWMIPICILIKKINKFFSLKCDIYYTFTFQP